MKKVPVILGSLLIAFDAILTIGLFAEINDAKDTSYSYPDNEYTVENCRVYEENGDYFAEFDVTNEISADAELGSYSFSFYVDGYYESVVTRDIDYDSPYYNSLNYDFLPAGKTATLTRQLDIFEEPESVEIHWYSGDDEYALEAELDF